MKTGFYCPWYRVTVRPKWTNTIVALTAHYSGARLKSILHCSWNVWALRSRQDGEDWTGGMIVTLISANCCCYERIRPSERIPANFPCLHSAAVHMQLVSADH